MDCESFRFWLKNKDMFDATQTELAFRHQGECEACRKFAVNFSAVNYSLTEKTEDLEGSQNNLADNLDKIVQLNLGSGSGEQSAFSTTAIKIISVCAAIAVLVMISYCSKLLI